MITLPSYLKRKSIKIICTYSAMFLMLISKAQQKTLYYDIVKSNEVIGHLVVQKIIDGNKTYYKLQSTVAAKFIFSYSNEINETVVFENGLMTHSFFHQTENGKETFTETKNSGSYFQMIKNGEMYSQENAPIISNILQLYTDPPSTDIKAFSNHFQQFIKVKKISENRFRLSLPEGGYNYYNYQRGVCTQIDVERTFFTIHIVLKNQK